MSVRKLVHCKEVSGAGQRTAGPRATPPAHPRGAGMYIDDDLIAVLLSRWGLRKYTEHKHSG